MVYFYNGGEVMSKSIECVKGFVNYLIIEKKLTKLDDERLSEEFKKYPLVSVNYKNHLTDRALSQIVKCICKQKRYPVTLISTTGRRFYSYKFECVDGKLVGEIKIRNA
jgi:hypothetical protein